MCEIMDPQQIVTAFHQGNREAFQQLHKMLFAELFRFCNNLSGNEQEAEDIASDTMFKLYQRRKDFSSLASIRGFLYVTARNSCMSHFRKLKRTRALKMKILPTLPTEQTTDDILDGLYFETLRALLRNYLKQLPEKQQQVLDLLYIKDYSLQEAAVEMSTKVPAIKQLRHRGLQRLRELLQSQSFMEGLTMITYLLSRLY